MLALDERLSYPDERLPYPLHKLLPSNEVTDNSLRVATLACSTTHARRVSPANTARRTVA